MSFVELPALVDQGLPGGAEAAGAGAEICAVEAEAAGVAASAASCCSAKASPLLRAAAATQAELQRLRLLLLQNYKR